MAELSLARIAKAVRDEIPGSKTVWHAEGDAKHPTLYVSTRAWTKVVCLALDMPDLDEVELIENILDYLTKEQK